MNPEVHVREGDGHDLETLASFNLMLAEETEERLLHAQVVRAGVAAALADPDKGRYFVAERAGRVLGQLMLTREWSDWRCAWFWWVQSVFIHPEHRGGGVFRALFRHVEALARDADGVCGLRLYMDHANVPARRTYERLGLTDVGYDVLEIDWT